MDNLYNNFITQWYIQILGRIQVNMPSRQINLTKMILY